MTLIDSQYIQECPVCAATLMPENTIAHGEWHRQLQATIADLQDMKAQIAAVTNRVNIVSGHVIRQEEAAEGIFEAHLEGLDCGRASCVTCAPMGRYVR